MKTKVLLIGSFLSNRNGTKGVSDKIAESDLKRFFDFKLASSAQSQFKRLVIMIWNSLLFRGRFVHIDVYSGLAFRYTTIISRIARLRGLKIIMTLHGGALPEYTKLNEKKVKKVLSRADHLQSPSKYLINFFTSIGLVVDYMPNFIDNRRFPYDRSGVKPYSLLWVRAFASIYNPDIPVLVLQALLKSFPETTLTMVGPDKGSQKEIEALVEGLGLCSQVNIVGHVPNTELFAYYQSHQLFLNTTSYESFGVAVIEAASCGIPIISNPIGEISYLWSNGSDMLFAENNEIRNFVQLVTEIFMNPELENRLSRNARAKVKQFDWDLIKLKWLKILDQ